MTDFSVADPSILDVAGAVSSGKCILFLGAGIHYGPPPDSPFVYPEAQRPPTGAALSQRLADRTNYATRFPDEGIGNLQRVAWDFEVQKQRAQLIREVRDAVQTGKRPSPLLGLLAELDFPLVITTNYDQLFEEALRDNGKDPFVSSYKKNEDSDEPTEDYPFDQELDPKRPFVYKIHGDIGRPESVVITDEDYIHFVLRMTDKPDFQPVPETFRYQFKKWPILFIGYSLKDYNLRLLFRTLRWKVDPAKFPPAYSVDLRPDPLVLDVYYQRLRYVSFLAVDVWKVVPELHRIVKEMTGKTGSAIR